MAAAPGWEAVVVVGVGEERVTAAELLSLTFLMWFDLPRSCPQARARAPPLAPSPAEPCIALVLYRELLIVDSTQEGAPHSCRTVAAVAVGRRERTPVSLPAPYVPSQDPT